MTTRNIALALAWTAAVLLACVSAHGSKMADRKLLVPHGKFAYASSYTDDSPMQQENLLALRTLIESLSPLQFPFLVFVTRTGLKSRMALADQGAIVVQVPELGVGFDDTVQFNKLHAWNYTEYQRIIYFEIGSVVVHPHELNELFLCGEFCAIYRSTPCTLSKELFVLKPDRTTYMDLLYNLESKFTPQNVSRAFSADQQFLSTFFSATSEAPMFNAAKGPSTEKFNRLPFQYSVPGFYFIEKKSWDLYRCGLLTHYIDPITTIYYGAPLPSLMMPWYWWSTWLEPGWWFLSARKRLGEPELPVVVLTRLLLCLILPMFAGNRLVSALIRWGGKSSNFPEPTAKILNSLGAILFSALLTIVCSFLSIRMTLFSFPATVPPVPGWILFIAFYHSYLLLLGRMVAGFVLAMRGAAYGHAFNFSDMKPSIIMWTIFACQPLIDESVSRYVKWNIVSKVLTNTPVVFFLLGTQFFMFFNLVRTSSKTPAIPA